MKRCCIITACILTVLGRGQGLDDFLVITSPDPVTPVNVESNRISETVAEDDGLSPAPSAETRIQVETFVRRASLLLQSNSVYAAGNLYYHAARLDPTHEGALAGLGTVFLLSGDAANAIPVFQRLTLDATGESEYTFNLASAYLKAGQPEKARRHLLFLSRILQKDPRIWYNLGMAELALNNPDAALEALDHCLELNDSHPFAHLGKARVYLSITDSKRASDELRLVRLQMSRKEFLSSIRDEIFDPVLEEPWIQKQIEKELE